MQKLTTLSFFVLFSTLLWAQKSKDIPGFGKVDKAELEMKECDFDKNAEAVVLFDVGELVCIMNMGLITVELEHHVRIKILKDKGLDEADIRLPYHSYRNDEDIRNITAQTYNLDAAGNIVVSKVEKKLVYEKKIDKRFTEKVFTFPDAKVGSIIEYKYIKKGAGLEDWYFQQNIPVKLSRYTVDFPIEFEISSQAIGILPYEKKEDRKAYRDITSFTMMNIPALRDEPYITCDNDYLQRIESDIIAVKTPERRISLVRTWPQIIKELMEDEDFGIQLKKEIPRTADLDDQLKKINDPYQKMVTIHNYVKKNMEWNGYSSIWALDGVKSAWKDKKGTSGEINLILVNLLKDAGLKAHPILLSTRKNGRVVTAKANYYQFNRVMAYVKIDNRTYVLDATDKYTPPKLIPYDVMFSEGLVIEKPETFEWGWQTLWDDKQQFKTIIIIQGKINEEGQLKGEATVNSFDYSRLNRMPSLKDGKEKFVEKYFASQNSGLKVDSVQIENEDVDTLPLIQRIHFSQPVSASGEYKYFSANIFSGLEKNPFVADTRFSDVFFAANQYYSIIGNFSIPEGYVFEDLPKSIRMIMPDTSTTITRRISAENNILSVRITVEFKKPYYTPEEYPDFQEFYKRLYDLLNEQYVIRKKVNP